VLVTDLDRFKSLNDTDGHAAGDEALQRFAEALRIAARSTDILARLGGDEFGVLLVRRDERAAHSFAARLREAVAGLLGRSRRRRPGPMRSRRPRPMSSRRLGRWPAIPLGLRACCH
jgi:diguanylate cyclase (GGDEF)-like protein